MEVTRRQVVPGGQAALLGAASPRRPCCRSPFKSAGAGPTAAAERRSHVKSRALEAEQYPPLVVFHHHQFGRLIHRLAKIVGRRRARGAMHQPFERHRHAVRALGNSLELQLGAHRVHRARPGGQHQRQKRDPHARRQNWPFGRASACGARRALCVRRSDRETAADLRATPLSETS